MLKKLVRLTLALLVGLSLTVGPQTTSADASPKSHVKALISKIIHSKNPKKTYSKLSKADRALVRKELKSGKTTVRLIGTVDPNSNANAVPAGSSDTSCWKKTLWVEYHGGVTTLVLFTTTNTTRVCVTGGVVSEVSVPEKYQDTRYIGWHSVGVTDSTLDVDWEGRDVARGSFDWGAAGWVLASKTLCAQLRLNADMVHYSSSSSCTVGA